MKFAYYILALTFLSTAPAFANVCGFLELANGDLLEVRKGAIYDLNDNLLGKSLPASKKLNITDESGTAILDIVKDKRKGKQIRLRFMPLLGKSIAGIVPQSGSLVFFDQTDNSFVFIKLKEGSVFRAKVDSESSKIQFLENEDEFFSKDICF
jgi:hypothetical protein